MIAFAHGILFLSKSFTKIGSDNKVLGIIKHARDASFYQIFLNIGIRYFFELALDLFIVMNLNFRSFSMTTITATHIASLIFSIAFVIFFAVYIFVIALYFFKVSRKNKLSAAIQFEGGEAERGIKLDKKVLEIYDGTNGKLSSILIVFFFFFFRRLMVAFNCCIYIWVSGLWQMIILNVVNVIYFAFVMQPCCTVFDSKLNYCINFILELTISIFFMSIIPMHYFPDEAAIIGMTVISTVCFL